MDFNKQIRCRFVDTQDKKHSLTLDSGLAIFSTISWIISMGF